MTSEPPDTQPDGSENGLLPPLDNPPGLEALNYRVRTYASFKSEMLAALGQKNSPLRSLAHAGSDDPTLALIDSWATTLDVLTFYQERIANEGYLRTLTELRSVLELGRAVGYELNPGVAAETYLAFTLDDGPDAPEKATIDAGTKVQSVPGPNEQAQVFETVEKIEARPGWNAMRPIQVEEAGVYPRRLYLRGIATQLQPGDAMLIVGDEREKHPTTVEDKERWDFRILTRVVPNPEKGWTLVTWEQDLGKGAVKPAEKNPRVYAFRQRAALFGHNAPDPNFIGASMESPPAQLLTSDPSIGWHWVNYSIQGHIIDLDAAYPKVLQDSWLALKRPPDDVNERGYVELYKALQVSFPSRSAFGLSAKITRVIPDTAEHLDGDFFKLNETIVYVQSEPLDLAAALRTKRDADAPSQAIALMEETLAPLEGSRILLDREAPKLPAGRHLIVTGKRIRACLAQGATGLVLINDLGVESAPLRPGETLVVVTPPVVNPDHTVAWDLQREDGFTGTLQSRLDQLVLTAALTTDIETSELVTVKACSVLPTEISLAGQGLQNVYDRTTVRIAANAALATHGETRQETLGSADASQSFQQFPLRQEPLTFTPAPTPSGGTSTLQVRVDGLRWDEAPRLYGLGPGDRAFTSRRGPDGKYVVQFGDGVSGARPPSGDENVTADYRVGLGAAGNAKANQLRVLLSRPLGVRQVSNPLPSLGGADPEDASAARENVPYKVLTLDRIVSLRDYEDFARAFAGVGKSRADWLWYGSHSVVFVSVIGADGNRLDVASLERLRRAIDEAHDPAQSVWIDTVQARRFSIRARLVTDRHYPSDRVLEQAGIALKRAFSLKMRNFGQDVTESEILGLFQSVDGVVAADLEEPYPGSDWGDEWRINRKISAPQAAAAPPTIRPAVLLLLDEGANGLVLRPVTDLGEPETKGEQG